MPTYFFRKFDLRAEPLDPAIMSLTDSGVIDGLFRNATPFAGVREQRLAQKEPLVLDHFVLVLLAGFAGLCLGSLVAGLEIYWGRKKVGCSSATLHWIRFNLF